MWSWRSSSWAGGHPRTMPCSRHEGSHSARPSGRSPEQWVRRRARMPEVLRGTSASAFESYGARSHDSTSTIDQHVRVHAGKTDRWLVHPSSGGSYVVVSSPWYACSRPRVDQARLCPYGSRMAITDTSPVG